MDRSFRAGLILLAGVALLATALALQAILLELAGWNYRVDKVSLLQGGDALSGCALLVVAGPKVELLPTEVAAVRAYLPEGATGTSCSIRSSGPGSSR